MTYATYKLEYTPFMNNTWDAGDTVELPVFRDLNVIVNTGEQRDLCKFTIDNFNNEYDNYFSPNDRVVVKRVINSETFPTDGSDILITMTVVDGQDSDDSKSNRITVSGYNYSETIAAAIVFIDAQNKTPAEIIQQALAWLSAKNPNFEVVWDTDNDTAISGLTFPTYSEKFFNKSLKYILEKYSVDKQTGNGDFYWYVSTDNKLVWRPKTNTVGGSFDVNTDTYTSLKTKKDISAVKNYFIMKGGYDPAGVQIQTPYVNWASVSRHGVKYQLIVSQNNTAKQLVDDDIKGSFAVGTPSPDGYPNITASAFTTTWRSNVPGGYVIDGVTVTQNNTITINQGTEQANRDTYVNIIRKEVKERLNQEALSIASSLQYGKLKVDITSAIGEYNFGLGTLVSCNIPKISGGTKSLRVTQIQYTENAEVYSLEEDKGTL